MSLKSFKKCLKTVILDYFVIISSVDEMSANAAILCDR